MGPPRAKRGSGPFGPVSQVRWIGIERHFTGLDEAGRLGIDVVVTGPADSPVSLTPRVRRFQLLMEVLATVYYAVPPTLTAGRRTPVHAVRHRIGQYLIRNEE